MKIRTAAGKALLMLSLFLLPFAAETQEQEPGPQGASGSAARPNRGPQGVDQSAMYAREEFRLGVQAYNRFSFNAAIGSFERALFYLPAEPLILDWLGRSYYRSGLEEIALNQWQAAVQGYGETAPESLVLRSRIETVRNRRAAFARVDEDSRYVEAGRYLGRYDDVVSWRQPTAALALEDGTAWVVAYGSNEIVRIDPNGLIRQRRRGPLNGFDRPYDLARGEDGKLFLSEFRGGRISVLDSDGQWLYYIGSKGLGEGRLMGPQNLALDEDGYLYVVDYGSRRIVKFDPSGDFIMSFGGRNTIGETGVSGDTFPGLLSPTGIAAGNGRVFVAESGSGRIFSFDRNGRFLGAVVVEGLRQPESLRLFPDGRLLTADTNRILLVDPDTALVSELGLAGSPRVRIIGAEADRNGNILAVNFNSDEVLVMTPIDEMASGLFVQIDRVISDNFPLVTVEIQVQDRKRRPVVGLDARNFLLSEEGRAVTEQNFLYAGYRSAQTDLAVLLERSPAALAFRDDFAAAVRDIDASESRLVSLVSAGEQPFAERLSGLDASGNPLPVSASSLAAAARGIPASYTARWRFDLGLRLAATGLLSGAKKRAVVYVGTGQLGELAFDQYGLSELAAYLANNGIVFYAVIVGPGGAGADIQYLCSQSGGAAMPLYRNEGIAPVLNELALAPSGSYIFNYRSMLPTDFGRAYLPIEAEAYLMNRSGRDRTGYFPPVE
ncbi:MAG: NHL repeat-containing protein [Spirochaetaceae bacterium]|jgi:DNA-binding beta-propeller fold protein YncE|nr:NHL repeat-containing protein [Spirochaetaceae bacterium]